MGHPRRLTPEGEAALAEVVRVRELQQDARVAAERRAAEVLEEGTRETDRALGVAVRAAIKAGVTGSRVHREGLGTSDWPTLERFIAMPAPTPTAV